VKHKYDSIGELTSQTVYFGEIAQLSDYFDTNGVKIPKETNPAEFMIDVVSGDLSKGRDWAQVWLDSENNRAMMSELEKLEKDTTGGEEREDDAHEYASTTMTQLKLVTKRASVQLYRDTEYVMNKVMLHVGSALFNGFR
jgi:hypothetical protein